MADLVFDLPLARDASDVAISMYAKESGLDIVTADGGDYPPLVQRLGPPPRVIPFAKLAVSHKDRARTDPWERDSYCGVR